MSSNRRIVQADDDRWLGSLDLCSMDPRVARQECNHNGTGGAEANKAAAESPMRALWSEGRRVHSVVRPMLRHGLARLHILTFGDSTD